MLKPSSSWLTKAALLGAVLVGLLAAPQAQAAPAVLHQSIDLHIRADGTLHRAVRLHLRIEDDADLDEARFHVIPLHETQTLVHADAYSLTPDGKRHSVGRKQRDTAELTLSPGTFHDSQRFEVFEFDPLEVGSEIHIAYEIEESPYFPASVIALRQDDPVDAFELTLRSDVPSWRHRLMGSDDDLEIVERDDGLTVRGWDLEATEAVDWGPDGPERIGVLHVAWDSADDWSGAGDWPGVGAWYADLLDDLARQEPTVRDKARELLEGVTEPRQKLEILTDFLRRQVRYVAVEVGIGGYRPTAPHEVLERRWGDCKDKSMLLIDLLRKAGIPAYPALIRAGTESRIATDFATPLQFNHLIVAVPQDAVSVVANDPLASGYLWLDPTQDRGGAGWLNRFVQDQHALVLEPTGGRLLATPTSHDVEGRALTFDLTIDGAGRATGQAHLLVQGSRAVALIEQSERGAAEATEAIVRTIVQRAQRGTDVLEPRWRSNVEDIPNFELRAGIDQTAFVPSASSPSIRLDGLNQWPPASEFRDRTEPVLLAPGIAHTVWRLRLPDGWCLPKPTSLEVENALGSFRQTITPEPSTQSVLIDRRTELVRRWIPVDELDALRELAMAEDKATKRRLRFRCERAVASGG